MVGDIKIKEIILRITEKIKEGYKPEKIILFGSYAKGRPERDSDIDLLVIKDTNYRRDERDREVRELLRDVKFPLDIFVYTPGEVEKFYNLKGSFIDGIFRNGVVLYERG